MGNGARTYRIHRADTRPGLDGDWDGDVWFHAATAHINLFRPEGSDHHPDARAKVLYDDDGLYVIFRVFDRYVRCLTTEYQGPVYTDSCVEFFVQPKRDAGYFNFEMNCGGVLLLKYIEDCRRTDDGFEKYVDVPAELGGDIVAYHTLRAPIEREIADPVEWRVEYAIPFSLLEHYVGPFGENSGQTWRGNFYKCADGSSHPHWASWSPIGRDLNFHAPEYFGLLEFE
jgi:hypothetical protein